ncbi:unnamed protein product [Parajaminaea phylloscopi]
MSKVEKKQEADFTSEVDALLPAAEQLAAGGKLQEALERIALLEKKSRNAADMVSTTRLLLASLALIRCTPSTSSTDWQLLNETIVSLSRKHGQLKQAITKMVQAAMCYLEPPNTAPESITEPPKEEDTKMEEAAKEVDSHATEPAEKPKTERQKDKERKELEKQREGKEAVEVTKLLERARQTGDVGIDAAARRKLVETLRQVTEGKIFVEVERARASRMLSAMLVEEGNLDKAVTVLRDLQVETFGSMERREKTEFIIEQMRLNLLKKEYVQLLIASRKINTKFFKEEEQHDLKLQYYDYMIQWALHEKKPLDTCKYWREILDTPRIKQDEAKAAEARRNVIVFLVLAPYDNEQSDLMARVEANEDLEAVAEHKNLLKCFTTPELMRWPGIEALYGPLLRQTPTFASDEDGNYRWEELHKRVVEHNIRVVGKYYTRITMARLAQLLDLPEAEAETSLCSLVTSGTVWARIDRPAGIVSLKKQRDTQEQLNSWSSDMNKLMGLVEDASHLINRERAVVRAGLGA